MVKTQELAMRFISEWLRVVTSQLSSGHHRGSRRQLLPVPAREEGHQHYKHAQNHLSGRYVQGYFSDLPYVVTGACMHTYVLHA